LASFALARFSSARHEENISAIGSLLAEQEIVLPDMDTAILYGQLRARLDNIRHSKLNDLWIAALCIQHDLPLLTNDRGFDTISELRTIHW
jgi:tRNA(fMet)-specific endonuclease VapC